MSLITINLVNKDIDWLKKYPSGVVGGRKMIGYKYDAVESFVYIRRVPVSNDNIVFESENARF